MQIDNLDVVIYTFQFLVPGYIISEISSAIMPKRNLSEGEKFLQSLSYSVLNAAIWFWAFQLVHSHFSDATWYRSIIDVFMVIVCGGITGFVLGALRSKQVLQRMAEKVHIILNNPVPTAWDYKFSDHQQHWVEITLSSGSVIRGLYSTESFASSDPDFRDVYIEQLYQKSGDIWTKAERTNGVWIHPDEIHYIKFYTLEDNYVDR